MAGFPFPFSLDASGSADEIKLPQDFPYGMSTIELTPPTGHAWTYYESLGGTGLPRSFDQSVIIRGPFVPLQVVGYGALDASSGSGKGFAT